MNTILKMNELNQLQKGALLFKQKEPVDCMGILIQGKIRFWNQGICRIIEKGSVISVADLFFQEYLGNYVVEENAIFYAFPICSKDLLKSFLNSNADYRGIIVHSMAMELYKCLKEEERLLEFASNMYEKYKTNEQSDSPESMFQIKCPKDKLANYFEYVQVPLELHKKFFYNSKTMAYYQAGEISEMIHEVLNLSRDILQYLDKLYWNETRDHFYEEESVCDLPFLENLFSEISNKQTDPVEDEEEEKIIQDPVAELKNSLCQILKYSGIKENEKKNITTDIETFVNAKDRLATTDDIRRLKKQITEHFFVLYEAVVFKWFENKNVPLAVKLFLDYGYIDERLLDESQILYLYEMSRIKNDNLPCRIYTMPEWLKEIYQGRKEPSRNSFEQDYRDWLREEKRTGKINEKQEKELLEDNPKKVKFEINNMFVSNNKIVNGKLSTYVPILYKDEIYGHIERLFVTKECLCNAIVELEKKDFTIFQREVLYSNQDLKIEKEYVLKHVYPDVIFCPVYGTASSMWQEITGKKRDTPGRFIFPTISEIEIEKLVTKAFGRFHWEYCRCEQGAAWNNIQYKSLTSEYMDYIQYYRKNRDLTEEKREKIKAQILKARNNSREVFLIDYELWIYYESKAAMKLNKIARSILATYCPFNKEIRENLKTNAAFADALMIHQKIFGEKKREWEMRIKRRENKSLEVPEEFYNTYNYYANN